MYTFVSIQKSNFKKIYFQHLSKKGSLMNMKVVLSFILYSACLTPSFLESKGMKLHHHQKNISPLCEIEDVPGYLLVVCGSMCSGKTEELIRIMSRLIRADKNSIAVFKPALDTRVLTNNQKDPNQYVTSRNGSSINCIPVTSVQAMMEYIMEHTIEIIGIDEAQFLPKEELVPAIKELIAQGRQIVISGLDLDFRAEPFGPMAELLAFADEIIKLTAICSQCGQDTYCITQRLVDGIPAHYNDPIIMVGEIGYEPRCRSCHIIRKD